VCGGKDITFPCVEEREDEIIIVYSDEEIYEREDDEGILLFYSRKGEIVKIIIPKDDEHYIIYLQ